MALMKFFLRFFSRLGVLALAALCLHPQLHGQSLSPASTSVRRHPGPKPSPATAAPSPTPVGPLWLADCKITRLGTGDKKEGVEAALVADLVDHANAGLCLLAKGTVLQASAQNPDDVLREGMTTKWIVMPAPSKTVPTEMRVLSAQGRATGKPSTPTVKVGRTFELTVGGIATEQVSLPAPTPSPMPTPLPGSPAVPVFTPPPAAPQWK